MSRASTENYDNAMTKYNDLVNKYTGSANYKDLYGEAANVAASNSKNVQQEKYNTYISQGMNPAKAARLASQDASQNYKEEKDNLVSKLYQANQDTVNAQANNIQHAKTTDDVSNQNKGRGLATIGGVVSGVANAL